jgi:hypothetical protein
MPGTFPYDFDFGTALTLPTRDDVGQGARRLDGCYVDEGEGEATFVPPKSFLSQPPLWRIDVLQDLMHDFELARRHAIVEWAQSGLNRSRGRRAGDARGGGSLHP